jgi:hypothetical protein
VPAPEADVDKVSVCGENQAPGLEFRVDCGIQPSLILEPWLCFRFAFFAA